MALRWKKNPPPAGLMRIVAGPRGSTLCDGGMRCATVNFVSKRNGHKREGWYWVAGWESRIPRVNTCNEPVADEATAKAQAMAYVKEHMKKGEGK